MTVLPKHGKISCRDCFKSTSIVCEPHPKWKLRNDPGAWGSQKPKVLVLGFSKGETQADIYSTGEFNDVAFGGGITRRYLTKILQKVGLLLNSETVDEKIIDTEDFFAFGSLVRCSAARLDEKHLRKTGVEKYITSGQLIIKSFSEIPNVIRNCSDNFIASLPDSVELICFLGVTDKYIDECKKIVEKLYPKGFKTINAVSYKNDNFTCVHLTHPSKGNGTKDAWLDADVTDINESSRKKASGKKRILAQSTIASTGLIRS